MIKTDSLDILYVMQNIEEHTSQKSLADAVGYSVGKVNYILKALLDKGLIKADNFIKSPNKRAYKYILTTEGLKSKIAITEEYIAIKKSEYETLQESLEFDRRRNMYANS